MSQHDLVSPQNHAEDMIAPLTSNVYITHHAALNAIASCLCQTISDALPARSLEDWFSVSRKGGTKIPQEVISPTLSANGGIKLSSYLHAVFKFYLLARDG